MELYRTIGLSHRRGLAVAALLASFTMGHVALAAEGSPTFAAAQEAAEQGRDADTIVGFQHIGSTKGWSAPVLYDLANAYARKGDVGRAIVNYERAQLLSPRDADIAGNLALTRQRAGLSSVDIPRHEALARLLSITAWCVVAVSGVWLACAAAWLARRRSSRVFGSMAACTALVSVLALGALGICAADRNVAVVVAAGTEPVRISPLPFAEALSTLAAGQEVSAVGRHGDFVRVDDRKGHTGWVPASAIELLIPRGG